MGREQGLYDSKADTFWMSCLAVLHTLSWPCLRALIPCSLFYRRCRLQCLRDGYHDEEEECLIQRAASR